MFRAIAEIQEEFRRREINCKARQSEGGWLLHTEVSGEAAEYDFFFIKDDAEDNDVGVWVFNLVRVPADRRDAVLEQINEFHRKYRYIRLILGPDDVISAHYGFPVEYPDIAEGAYEIMIRMTRILDLCYDDLVRAAGD